MDPKSNMDRYPLISNPRQMFFYQTPHGGFSTLFPTKVVWLHSCDKPWMTDKVRDLIPFRQKAFCWMQRSCEKETENQIIQEITKGKAARSINRVRHLQRCGDSTRIQPFQHEQGQLIHAPDIDPDNHIAIASAFSTHLDNFSQTQQLLQRDVTPWPNTLAMNYLASSSHGKFTKSWKLCLFLSRGPCKVDLLKWFAYELS